MICPSCSAANPDDAAFCGSCGDPLVSETPCPRCGRENPRDLKFCRGCGVRLGEVEPAATRRSVSLPGALAGGRYTIERFLGEGGRKRVFLALDSRLDRRVAVAVIKTEGLDESGLTRVRREAQAMARLGDHPNIVTVFDIGEEDATTYLVCQFMGGGSVEDLLERSDGKGLGIDESVRIATQVAQALDHAHTRGVVHRDVKPGNIWLADDGAAKLGDFGLAVALDRSRLTAEGMMLGTVAYMAPEQALGRQPDARSDLYSLGAMLYEMLTGRPPFLGDEAVAVISQHIGTAAVAPSWHNPDVPPMLEKLVLALLAKDPDARPATAAAVVEALAQASAAPSASAASIDARQANPLDRLAGGVFVGREREMDELRGALDDALSGRGRLLLLMGEPGIGKTRMTEELSTWAKLRGSQVLVGRCYEGEGAPPYWPWVQVIRSYIHDRDAEAIVSVMGQGVVDIAQVVSEIRERVPDLAEPPQLDPEQARFRLFDSISMFLRSASRAQPLVVVLDDLHWADKPSLLLLQFLAREIRTARLLIVATYRDVELRRQHPLAQALAELAREQISSRVVLRGITEQDVARYIEMTAGTVPPGELVRVVHRETEGNPFFVSEIVRLLASEGRLERPTTGAWSISIPQSVREVVGRRLDQLSESSNALLQIASVVGREFALGVVQAVSDLDGSAVTEAIDEAVATRLVAEAPRSLDRYVFSHALIRETLYEEIPTTRRIGLHRKIGGVLEMLYQDAPEPHLAELAYHFLEAAPGGDVGKAISYAERAAVKAISQLAYEEATKHYRMALEALELAPADPALRCRLLLESGEASRRAGDIESARSCFFQAADLAKTTGDGRALAQAAIGLRAGASFGSVDERRAVILEEALDAVGEGDLPLRSRLLAELARTLYFGPDAARVRTLADESVETAERSDDHTALAEALSARAYVLWFTDGPEERIAAGERISELGRRAGETEVHLDGIMWRMIGLGELPDIKRAAAAVREYSRIAEESRIPRYLLYSLSRQATIAAIEGRFADFDRLSLEALEVGNRAQEPDAIQVYTGQSLSPAIQRGDRDKLASFMVTEAELAKAFRGTPQWFHVEYAYVHMALGEREEALREYEAATANGLGELYWQGIAASMMLALTADVAAWLGRLEYADQLAELLAPFERRNIVVGGLVFCFGPGAYFLGRLAAAQGKLDEAAAHYATAAEVDEGMGARPYLAITLVEHADVLLKRGKPGDAAEALRMLDRALELARTLGMTPTAERAVAMRFDARGEMAPLDVRTSIDRVSESVEREKPDLRTHAAPDGTVTLLFTDIEGSTALNEKLGDRRWIELLRAHNTIVREQVSAHGGFEVKSQGDGFMVAFSSATRALSCAIGIQRGLAAFEAANPGDSVRVRIGLHTGEAIVEAGDFYGRHVNLAARVGAAANGGEILVSALLKELTGSSGAFTFGEAREVQLKGLAGSHQVYPVVW
jgi:class 3 adenylate cyclase